MDTKKSLEALQAAAKILTEAKGEVAAILVGPEHGTLALGVEAKLATIINNINFAAGQVQVAPVDVSTSFPPVTEIMGQKIEAPKQVTKEEITPKEDEKSKFIDKVNDLQANFPNLENTKILEEFTTKEDKAAIRGVAKRAGLTDFKTATIDAAYLDLIREGLKELAKGKQDKVNAENQIDKAKNPSESKDK